MQNKQQQNPHRLVPLKEASQLAGYHPDYLSALMRGGKLKGERDIRGWHTTKVALYDYLADNKPETALRLVSQGHFNEDVVNEAGQDGGPPYDNKDEKSPKNPERKANLGSETTQTATNRKLTATNSGGTFNNIFKRSLRGIIAATSLAIVALFIFSSLFAWQQEDGNFLDNFVKGLQRAEDETVAFFNDTYDTAIRSPLERLGLLDSDEQSAIGDKQDDDMDVSDIFDKDGLVSPEEIERLEERIAELQQDIDSATERIVERQLVTQITEIRPIEQVTFREETQTEVVPDEKLEQLEADIQTKVAKSGDTMSGSLLFEDLENSGLTLTVGNNEGKSPHEVYSRNMFQVGGADTGNATTTLEGNKLSFSDSYLAQQENNNEKGTPALIYDTSSGQWMLRNKNGFFDVITTEGTDSTGGSGNISGSGASGQVSFFSSDNSIDGDNNLFWDNANKRLGVGTSAPSVTAEIAGETRLTYDPGSGNSVSFGLNNTGGRRYDLLSSSSGHSTNPNGFAIFDRTNSAYRFLINATGNIGIAETNPSALLHVAGTGLFKNSSNSTTSFQIQNAAGTTIFNADTVNSRVGIGTTSPTSPFDVRGTGELASFGQTGLADQYISFRPSGVGRAHIGIDASLNSGSGGLLIQAGSNKTISFAVDNDTFGGVTPAMTILEDGNVGIGTNDPDTKLSIFQSGGGAGDLLHFRDTTDTADLIFRYTGSSYQLRSETGGAGNLLMTFLDGGNIGIGTTNPTSTLAVDGDFHAMASSGGSAGLFYDQSANRVGVGTDTPVSTLQVQTPSGTETSFRLRQEGVQSWVFKNPASHTRLDIHSISSGSDVMTLLNNGNVGINETSPGAQLQVNANSSTTVGQIIKGAASQAAYLQQWRNSAGTILAGVTANGQLRAADGSVGVPSLSFESDQNTGLYRIAEDNLGISAGGSEIADFRNNAGNLAIGLLGATPSSTEKRVDVSGEIRAIGAATGSPLFAGIVSGDTTRRIVIEGNGTIKWSDGTNALDTNLYRSGTDTLRTDDKFIVGNGTIGASQLGVKLDNDRVGQIIRLSSGQTADALEVQDSAGAEMLAILGDGAVFRTADAGSNWSFVTRVQGDADQRMIIRADGEIQWGDGTNQEDTSLYRNAANVLRTDDSLFTDSEIRIGKTTVNQGDFAGTLLFSNTPHNWPNGPKISAVQTAGDADQQGLAFFTHPSSTFTEASVEALRIDHNGNVGIGTTNPTSTLAVDGDFHAMASSAGAAGLFYDQSANRVGIGLTNPQEKLVVTSAADPTLLIGDNSATNAANSGKIAFTEDADSVGAPVENAWLRYDGSTNKVHLGTAEIGDAAFTIKRITGNVGINETSPGAQLQVNANSSTTVGQIIKLAASQTANALEVQDSGGTNLFNIKSDGRAQAGFGTVSAPGLTFAQDTDTGLYRIGTDNLGITAGGTKTFDISAATTTITTTLFASGLTTEDVNQDAICITAGNQIVKDTSNACDTTSSKKYKQNIQELNYGLNEVLNLKPSFYEWKGEYVFDRHDKGRHIGLIAEDVAQVVPELAFFDQEGNPQGVNYNRFVALNTKAIQELNSKLSAITNASSTSQYPISNIQYQNEEPSFTSELTASLKDLFRVAGMRLRDGVVTMWELAVDRLTTRELTIDAQAPSGFKQDATVGQATLGPDNRYQIPDTGETRENTATTTQETNIPASPAGRQYPISNIATYRFYNDNVKPTSKVFVTFTSPLDGRSFHVEKDEGYFDVILSSAAERELNFDYWIVQVKDNEERSTNNAVPTGRQEEQEDQNSNTTTTPQSDTVDAGQADSLIEESSTSTEPIVEEEATTTQSNTTTTQE